MREQAFGQTYAPSFVDRFGVWLSSRQIRRWVRDFQGKRVGDFGCGFNAAFSRTLVEQARSLTLVDVALANDLKAHRKITAHEGNLLPVVSGLADASLDVVLCVSVLEHLWEPEAVLKQFQRVLAPEGVCLLNVPSWRGKAFLEFSAFRLGLSPADEMDDHKAYYDPRDLWPLLVRAGFKPSGIRCFKHKFGLNTFAVCRKGSA